MNARNNYLMNTLVLVSPDMDTARKSGIGYLDLRFSVRARFPTILNRRSFRLFSLSLSLSPVHLSLFFPHFLLPFFLPLFFCFTACRYFVQENQVKFSFPRSRWGISASTLT